MKTVIKFLLIIFIIGSFSNKAFARKVSLSKMKLELSKINGNQLGIIIWDQRPMITDQSQDESYLGFVKSPIGIIYPQYIKSKQGISKTLLNKIQEAYNLQSIKINIIESSPFDRKKEILKKVMNYEHDKVLLITLNNLQFDGKFKVEYMVNIELQLMSNNGKLLFDKNIVDKISVFSSIKKAVPQTLKNVFENLLNADDVIDAINNKVDRKNDNNYDVIITKEGEEISSKIIEVDLKLIKYKPSNNLNGPIRTISISDVFMVKYQNGDNEVFKE